MKLTKNVKVGKKIVVTGDNRLSGQLLLVKSIKGVKYLQPVSWVDGRELICEVYAVKQFTGLVYAHVSDSGKSKLKKIGNFFKKIATYSTYSE